MIYTPEHGVLIHRSWIKENSFNNFPSPPEDPTLWGSPEYNPLLQTEIPLSEEAIEVTQEIGIHPYLASCVQVNKNGGLLDPQWRNCFGHNVLAGKFNMADAALLGFPLKQILEAGATGLLHDVSQRINKEQMRILGKSSNGRYVTTKVPAEDLFKAEWNELPVSGVEGLQSFMPHILSPTRVTHLDWRPFFAGSWSMEDIMARLMDSSIAATRNEDGAYGEDTIIDPFLRISMLKEYKPELHELGKKPEYYNRPTFDVLDEITENSLELVKQTAEYANPTYMQKYYDGNYINLISQIVSHDVPMPLITNEYVLM